MSPALQFEEDASRKLEATYTTPDVVAQRREVRQALNLKPGERVLDVGTGPGFLAREMAAEVGSSGRVEGVDVSESMLAMARARCRDAPQVSFRTAGAGSLPFPDGAFDAVVSTQVYEYVDDVSQALAEVHRVLRDGGRALILDTDWDSIVWSTTDRERFTRIMAAWDEHATDPYLPRSLSALLRDTGFEIGQRRVIVMFNPEHDPNTFSYGISRLIASFVVGRLGLTQADVDAWLDELAELGKQERYFFSLNRYLFLAQKNREKAAQ